MEDQGVFSVDRQEPASVLFDGDNLQWGQASDGLLPTACLRRRDIVQIRGGPGRFELHCWPQRPAQCCGTRARRRVTYEFVRSGDAGALYTNLADALQEGRPKRLKVLLNPIGGPGRAERVWVECVAPLFELAEVATDVHVTTHHLDALELCRAGDLSSYDGLVCVGGDGLLSEAINGLMQQSGPELAIRIGVIPAGSGNGMAKSVAEASGESCDPVSATLAIVNGCTVAADLLALQQSDKVYYSLSFSSFGFLSDADIESEHCRCCGDFRFTWQAVVRFCCLRTYQAGIRWKAAAEEDWEHEHTDFVAVCACMIPWQATNVRAAPQCSLGSGKCHLVLIRASAGRCAFAAGLLALEDGDWTESSAVEVLQVSAFELHPQSSEKGMFTADGEVLAKGSSITLADPSLINKEHLFSLDQPIQAHVLPRALTLFGFDSV